MPLNLILSSKKAIGKFPEMMSKAVVDGDVAVLKQVEKVFDHQEAQVKLHGTKLKAQATKNASEIDLAIAALVKAKQPVPPILFLAKCYTDTQTKDLSDLIMRLIYDAFNHGVLHNGNFQVLKALLQIGVVLQFLSKSKEQKIRNVKQRDALHFFTVIFKSEVGFEIAKNFLDLFILELRLDCNKFVPFMWALVDQIECFSKLCAVPQRPSGET